jgi:hypothetical protein
MVKDVACGKAVCAKNPPSAFNVVFQCHLIKVFGSVWAGQANRHECEASARLFPPVHEGLVVATEGQLGSSAVRELEENFAGLMRFVKGHPRNRLTGFKVIQHSAFDIVHYWLGLLFIRIVKDSNKTNGFWGADRAA